MRKISLFLFLLIFPFGLIAQETSLGKVVNTLKERISLSVYAQLGYTYNSTADPNNTFDIKRIIFMEDNRTLVLLFYVRLCRHRIAGNVYELSVCTGTFGPFGAV